MGKTGKWIRSFLTGKKDRDKEKDKDKETILSTNHHPSTTTVPTDNLTTPIALTPTTPKEKRRWSFRRSTNTSPAASKDSNSIDNSAAPSPSPPPLPLPAIQVIVDSENEQKKHAMAMAAATAAAADAAIAAAQAAAAVIRLTAAANEKQNSSVEEAAAIKIQSVFRSYLARKALYALKGLVKLQALVRGHLVRKQAATTLRCMQALVTLQARARAQRIRTVDEANPIISQRPSTHRKSLNDNCLRQTYNEMDRGMEENIKIVEMDLGESRGSSKSRNSYSTSHPQTERVEPRFSTYYSSQQRTYQKQDHLQQISPAPSALTDMSPRTCSGHFKDFYYSTAQSSPQFYSAVSKPDPTRVPFAFPRPECAESMPHDYPFFPNYMANTESSRAKVRSHSAPKQRPDSYERQPVRRRASIEGRNVPRAVRMQRSSSHVGATVHNYQYPWSIKLDRSTVSLKDSECGSTSTVLTNTNYCRSLVAYEPHGNKY